MFLQFLLELVDALLLQHVLVVQRDLLEGHAFPGVMELSVVGRGIGEVGVSHRKLGVLTGLGLQH